MIVKKDLVLAIMRDTLGAASIERLGPDRLEMIVESCFTRLGGSGLIRWIQINDEPPLPGHGPFSAARLEDEDVEAGRRIIARTIETFA
ncbi:MAG: hypothetical protein GY725_15835 [bacterium]|nr:hypothetical protein [bacterium]